MVRKARERYEQYKSDIIETGPDFRPFVTHVGYIKPGLPGDDDERVGSLGDPMDLTYVGKVIKEYVCSFFPNDMLNLRIDLLDGNSRDTSRLMPPKN